MKTIAINKEMINLMWNYDQWKTASPYDDEVDWSEHGAECPKCQCELAEEIETRMTKVRLMCDDCGHEFWFKIPDHLIM